MNSKDQSIQSLLKSSNITPAMINFVYPDILVSHIEAIKSSAEEPCSDYNSNMMFIYNEMSPDFNNSEIFASLNLSSYFKVMCLCSVKYRDRKALRNRFIGNFSYFKSKWKVKKGSKKKDRTFKTLEATRKYLWK